MLSFFDISIAVDNSFKKLLNLSKSTLDIDHFNQRFKLASLEKSTLENQDSVLLTLKIFADKSSDRSKGDKFTVKIS